MVWQYNPYAFPFFLAACVAAGLAVVTLRRRGIPGAIWFIAMLALIAEWAISDFLEFMSADLPSMLLWDKATYVGIAAVPAACLIFVIHYTGRGRWLTPRNLALLSIIPVITILLRWKDESYRLIYSEYGLTTYHNLSLIQSTYGTWLYVDVAYSYVLLLFAMALLGGQFSRSQGATRNQSLIIMSSILLPLIASVIDVLNLTDYPFDWTPLALTFSAVALFWAVFRFHLYGVTPAASETVVRNMQDGVIVLDSNDRLVGINPAGEEILGAASGIVGKPLAEILSRTEATAKKRTDTSQICFAVNGVQRYFDLSFSDLRDSRTRKGRIGVLREITERKRSEEELSRLAAIVEGSNDAIVGKTLDGTITSWNRGAERLYGYSADEMKGKPVSILIPRSQPDELKQILERIKAGDRVEEYETKRIRKDGTIIDVSIAASPVRDSLGRIVQASSIARDITKRKQLESENVRLLQQLERHANQLESIVEQRTRSLRASEKDLRIARERLEYTIDSNPAVIYLAKPLADMSDYTPVYISKNVASMVGFDREKFVGNDGAAFWASRVHPDDLGEYRKGTARFWAEAHRTCEYRFLHKSGKYRWIMEEANVIHDSAGNVREVIGSWADITERKQLEDALLKSQRFAVIGELAAMVGHDLRSPMQGITGATYLLKDDSLTNEQRQQLLQLIDDSVAHANRIVGDLLDYSREIHLTLNEITPKELVRTTLEVVKIPDAIRVLNQSEDHPTMTVDPERMRRVLVNLIVNAVDAMPDGGSLTIDSKDLDGLVEITVSDTGQGLAKEIRENLWKPLQTTRQKGMGLGLPIVKRFVDAHSGEVTVETKQNEGTTFTIRLPVKCPGKAGWKKGRSCSSGCQGDILKYISTTKPASSELGFSAVRRRELNHCS